MAKIFKLTESMDNFKEAIEATGITLADGGLVIIPTETVYGIAVAVDNHDAVERLYALKKRDKSKPLIRLICHFGEVWPELVKEDRVTRKLALRYWPGALTIIMGEDKLSQAYRLPNDNIALAVIDYAKKPVCATSANISEDASPSRFEDIPQEILDNIDVAIDAGDCHFGLASTIVKSVKNKVEVIRAGSISEDELKLAEKFKIGIVCTGNTCRSPMGEELMRNALIEELQPIDGRLENVNCEVVSFGTATADGLPASENSLVVMAAMGYDVSGHKSTLANFENLADCDVIYTMTNSHKEHIVSMMPEIADRISTLCPDGHNISDPYGGSVEIYTKCADEIKTCIEKRVKEICELL